MANRNSESNKITSSTGITPLEPDEYCATGDVTGSVIVPEAGDCCTADDNLINEQETCKMETSSTSPRNVPGCGGCLATCISASDTFNGPETDVCVSTCSSVGDTFNVSSESFIQLLEAINSSSKVFYGVDFMKFVKIIRDQEKKLFTNTKIDEIKKFVKEYYGKEFNMEDYHQTLDALNKFSVNVAAYEVSVDIFYPKVPDIVQSLNIENLSPEGVFSEWFDLEVEMDHPSSCRRIAQYKRIDFPGIVDYMKALQETGFLSEIILSRFKKLANELEDLSMVLGYQTKKMDDLAEKVYRKHAVYSAKSSMDILKEKLEFSKHCEENVSFEVCEREIQVKKTDTKIKSKSCRSEHNIPFCGNCGWRNSWLKAFKKRGVYVMEAVNGTKEHIWYNNLNSC